MRITPLKLPGVPRFVLGVLMNTFFGCKHRQMGRPVRHDSLRWEDGKWISVSVRYCLKCGALREFDLNRWETVGPYFSLSGGRALEVGTDRPLLWDDELPQRQSIATNNEQHVVKTNDNASSNSGPPKFGEFLLYFFLTPPERVNLIGDLAEEFNELLPKFGRRAAKVWFYKQVFDSLWPLIKRILLRGTVISQVAKTTSSLMHFIQEFLRR